MPKSQRYFLRILDICLIYNTTSVILLGSPLPDLFTTMMQYSTVCRFSVKDGQTLTISF